MAFSKPNSFSPSSLSQFTSCPLAFRFSYIDHRPSPPQISATKGSIVHRALEHLFIRNPEDRTLQNAHSDLENAFKEYKTLPDLIDLNLSPEDQNNLEIQSHELIDKYFEMENPKEISPIGLELKLEAKIGDTTIRGIIDRLELDSNGDLVVTDYKTGSVPRQSSQQSRMAGVHLYALLCQNIFGRLPSKVQLLYLSGPATIIAIPTPSSTKGAQQKVNAIEKAVVLACEKGDFRPNVSALCNWCGYRDLCPAQGGKLPND